MGHPQVRESVPLMTQHGGIPAPFQGDREGQKLATTKSDGMWNFHHASGTNFSPPSPEGMAGAEKWRKARGAKKFESVNQVVIRVHPGSH
jgi:hypothetical protein